MKTTVKIIVITIIISVIGFAFINTIKVKTVKKIETTLSIKYYDNARIYKIDLKNNKFYLISDFKKKQIA